MRHPPVMGAVTVQRPGGTNQVGDPLPGTEHQIPDCTWAPRTSSELNDLRSTVIVGYWLFGPHDADIRPTDKVLLPDVLDGSGEPIPWQVDGEPGRWESAYTGRRPGMQAALKRWEG